MIPRAWLVTWQALGDRPAGSFQSSQRATARGVYMMRKAQGFAVSIEPQF